MIGSRAGDTIRRVLTPFEEQRQKYEANKARSRRIGEIVTSVLFFVFFAPIFTLVVVCYCKTAAERERIESERWERPAPLEPHEHPKPAHKPRPIASPPKPAKAKPAPAVPQRTCCKHCRKGKPCGNSCIASHKVCHKGPGCAC